MDIKELLEILLSAGTNYPVMSDLGFFLNKVPTLIVDPGQTAKAVELLSSPGSCAIDEYINGCRLREALTRTRSAFVIIPYSRQNGDTIIRTLCSVIRTREHMALPILITEKPYVDDPDRMQFFIFASGELSEYTLCWEKVVPYQASLPVVVEKCKESIQGTESQEEMFWIAAASFLYPSLGKGSKFEALLETAKLMPNIDESCRETDELSDEFVEVLNKWHRDADFRSIFELPYLEEEAVGNLQGSMFYDAEYLYIPEGLFKMICLPLLKYVPVGVLKDRLREEGILKVDRSGGYTVKRTFYNPNDERLSMRVMRFERSRTNEVGELDLVKACEIRKGK